MALIEELEKQGNFLFRYRGQLPVVFLLAGLLLYWFVMSEMEIQTLAWKQYEVLCVLVSLFGLAIRAFTIGHTPKNTSGRNTSEGQIADELNSSGIYSIVRHPLYVGNFFMWLGLAMYPGQLWFVLVFILAYWLYYERIMFAEEQFLRKKFGAAYLSWSEKTPAFVPRLSQYIKPTLPFSFKNVLKREYSGLLNLFIAVLIFEIVGDFASKGTFTIEDRHWAILFLLSLVLALVLRTLKKQTRLLHVEGR